MNHHWGLLIFDFICVGVLSIHLTDIDLAMKITASAAVIFTNIVVLFRKNKKDEKGS